MKKRIRKCRTLALALLLALALGLCACGRSGPRTAHETPPGPSPEPPPEAALVSIRHFELDAGEENLEFYFEIPVLEEDTPAAERFNAFFTALYEDFAASEPAEVREVLAAAAPGAPTAEDPYRYCWTARAQDCSERWISVSLSYDWYMGGVLDYGIDGYTFDRSTGQRLFLDDVLPGSEEEIRAAIARGLTEKYPEVLEMADAQGNTPLTALEGLSVPEIDFYIAQGGAVTVVFDKYEIAPGAAGMFTVEVDLGAAGETASL